MNTMGQNFQKELDEIVEKLTGDGKRKRLLLHVCCAPCASYVLEYLAPFFDITAFFYNPNIFPEEEYDKRLRELKKLLSAAVWGKKTELIEGKYLQSVFEEAAAGLETEREGGRRCIKCIGQRLEETARMAASENYDYFCTTLSVSPHKNAEMINSAGQELSRVYGVMFLPSDFKKKDGYKKSVKLCEEYGIYRQNYCGCRYSLRTTGTDNGDDL